MQNAIVPPQLKVVFFAVKFEGEQLFPKNAKGQKRVEVFLRSLRKNHEDVKVQITTV